MDKMDFFLREHNLNSAIFYLLITSGVIAFGFCFSVWLSKFGKKI